MNGYEKILAVVMPPIIWIGSMEWRMRNKVGRDRFEDLKEYMKEFRTETKDQLDKIELTIKNNNG